MKFTKNKKYNPKSSMLVDLYEFKLDLNEEERATFFLAGHMSQEQEEWLDENIGNSFQPWETGRSWAASSITRPGFYFTHEEDAMHFKLVWE